MMKQEKRTLPEVTIEGIPFYADAIREVLIDKENPDNTISTAAMLPQEDHYEFVLDKETRTLKPHNWGDLLNERYAYVWIRPLEVYDSEGAKIRIGQEDGLIPKNLPAIDIDGTKFLWDRENTRLLQKDNPYNQIHKCSFDVRSGDMGIYFDRKRKMVLFPQETQQFDYNGALPKDIRFVSAAEINRKINRAENPAKREVHKKKRMRA